MSKAEDEGKKKITVLKFKIPKILNLIILLEKNSNGSSMQKPIIIDASVGLPDSVFGRRIPGSTPLHNGTISPQRFPFFFSIILNLPLL